MTSVSSLMDGRPGLKPTQCDITSALHMHSTACQHGYAKHDHFVTALTGDTEKGESHCRRLGR